MSTETAGYDKIERYLLNRLSDDERNAFEIQLLDDPALLEEVQQREAMINALKENSHTLLSSDKKNSGDDNVIRLSFSQWVQQPLSLAASVVVAVGAILLSQGNTQNTSPELAIADLSGFSSSAILETRRGADDRISISGAAPILLSIDVGPAPEGLFSVSLVNDANDRVVSTANDLSIDSQGWLRVRINRELTGAHSVRVTGDNLEITYPVQFAP